MIGFLKDWPPGALSLIGQDVLNLPNMSIFDPRNSFPGRD
jgi:hypothetical protein